MPAAAPQVARAEEVRRECRPGRGPGSARDRAEIGARGRGARSRGAVAARSRVGGQSALNVTSGNLGKILQRFHRSEHGSIFELEHDLWLI